MNHIIISATLYMRAKKSGGCRYAKSRNRKSNRLLLSAALNKCGNLEDAQDLTQDTLLAALTYLSNGNPINDIRGWLLTVLNRKFIINSAKI